jgi:D-glucosaminate-specific PTS system IID component
MENKVLTKKDVTKAWLRWQLFAENTHSYERMQAIGVCSSFGESLEKIYTNNKENFPRALQRHMVFFNSQAVWGGAALGIALAMEEQLADKTEDEKDIAINGVKTSLMGPLAALGDSIDFGTLSPIICGIGLTFSNTGSVFGMLFPILFCAIITFMSYKFWFLGYERGADAIVSLFEGPLFKTVLKSASLLGMFMMGVLTANYVELATILEVPTGDATLSIQSVLDSIVPGLLPLAIVLILYYLLRNKTQKIGVLSIVIVIVALIGSLLKVF